MNNILIVGGGGYIGSEVSNFLSSSYNISVLDRFFFQTEDTLFPEIRKVVKDIRDICLYDLKGIDTVIDLSGLSNDPSGDLDPALTISINQEGRMKLADHSKMAGVKKYIFCSSCSVYGFNNDLCHEQTKKNPLTLYAKSCSKLEDYLETIASPDFNCQVLRFGTVFGFSNRMRMDLVVQMMIKNGLKNKLITVNGGDQYRPLVSINAIRNVILEILDADDFETFDIMNLFQSNVTINSLAEKIAGIVDKDCKIKVLSGDKDFRDYRASKEKISKRISFELSSQKMFEDIDDLVRKMRALDFGDPRNITVNWYKSLLNIHSDMEKNGHINRS